MSLACFVLLAKLRKSRDQGKLVPNTRAWATLNDSILVGEAAQELYRLGYMTNPSPTTIVEMTKQIEILVEKSQEPTVNLWRRYCVRAAEAELYAGHTATFVAMIFPEGDEQDFDPEDPHLRSVPVTAEDEEAAAAYRKQKPDGEKGWTMEKALAEEAEAWPALLTDAFACDPLFKALSQDVQLAVDVCTHWLELDREMEEHPKETTAASTKQSVEKISTFCRAYLAVAGKVVMTPSLHECYKKVFQTRLQKAEKDKEDKKWFAMMASGARAHKDWAEWELAISRMAAHEIQHAITHARFMDMDMSMQSVTEIVKVLPDWYPVFRVGRLDALCKRFVDWISSEIDDYVDGDKSIRVGGVDKSTLLSSYAAFLDIFSEFETVDAAIVAKASQATKKASSCTQKLVVNANSDAICSMGVEDVRGSDFFDKVLSLKGHDQVVRSMQANFVEIAGNLRKALVSQVEEADFDAQKIPTLMQLSRNLGAIDDLWQSTVGSQLDALACKVGSIMDAALSLQTEGNKYMNSKSITNLNSLQKVVRDWLKLKKEVLHEDAGKLFNGLERALSSHFEAHAAGCKAKCASAIESFNKELQRASMIAYGLRNGKSWKEDISENATVQHVLNLASQTLLKGPGARVSKLQGELANSEKLLRADFAKYVVEGDELEKQRDDLIALSGRLQKQSQVTLLESQLARSLLKDSDAEKKDGVDKYLKLYASVSPDDVQPKIWAGAQALIHK